LKTFTYQNNFTWSRHYGLSGEALEVPAVWTIALKGRKYLSIELLVHNLFVSEFVRMLRAKLLRAVLNKAGDTALIGTTGQLVWGGHLNWGTDSLLRESRYETYQQRWLPLLGSMLTSRGWFIVADVLEIKTDSFIWSVRISESMLDSCLQRHASGLGKGGG